MSGLGLMLQRLRAAVPLHAASAPDTPDAAGADGDDGGTTGAGDVESLLAPTNAGGRGGGRAGRLPLRVLEAYGERRRRFVGRFKFMEPVVSTDLPVHLLALSLTLWIWGVSLARAHTFTLFSFHPVFMSTGCVLLMTEGVVAYRNFAVFNCLSPIMKNSARVKLQNIHRGLHIMAACFVGMGMAFIFSNKVKKHRTLLPTSIHAALGFLVCGVIILQVLAGIEKLDAQRSGVESVRGGAHGGGLHRWHGKAGLVLYDLSMLTVATGLLKSLHPSAVTLGMLALLCMLWLLVHLQILVKPVRPGIGGLNDTAAGDRELVSVGDRGRRESRGGSVGGLVGGRKDSLGGDGLGLAAESI